MLFNLLFYHYFATLTAVSPTISTTTTETTSEPSVTAVAVTIQSKPTRPVVVKTTTTNVITTDKSDDGDKDNRLILILVILAAVIAILIGTVVSVIAVKSRMILQTFQKPNMTGQHSQKVFHSSKVQPIINQTIKGLHCLSFYFSS